MLRRLRRKPVLAVGLLRDHAKQHRLVEGNTDPCSFCDLWDAYVHEDLDAIDRLIEGTAL